MSDLRVLTFERPQIACWLVFLGLLIGADRAVAQIGAGRLAGSVTEESGGALP